MGTGAATRLISDLDAMTCLLGDVDSAPNLQKRLEFLDDVRVELHRDYYKESYTLWNFLDKLFTRGFSFDFTMATAEAVCIWTKTQESELGLAARLMDEREDFDECPEFPIGGVVACAAVHQDTRFLQRMFDEWVIHVDPHRDSIFNILSVAGLLHDRELVDMVGRWESKSLELFDIPEWTGFYRAAMWTGDNKWIEECRSEIKTYNRLHWQELVEVEEEALELGPPFTAPRDYVLSWLDGHDYNDMVRQAAWLSKPFTGPKEIVESWRASCRV